MSSTKSAAVLLGLSVVALVACATEPPPEPLRLLVKTAVSDDDGAAIAAWAASAADRPVRYLASSGGGWHALSLSCRDAADCDAALQRVRADRRHFEAVQRDERKRIVTP